MGPFTPLPANPQSWGSSDSVLQNLSIADQLLRQHLAKGGGEASVATLFAALLDRTGLYSSERAVLQACYKLLSEQVRASINGEFAQEPFPAEFTDAIFDQYFGAEPMRKAEFLKRVRIYLPPEDFARAERHVRDRGSGSLRPLGHSTSSSSGLFSGSQGTPARQMQEFNSSVYDRLAERLFDAAQEVERLKSRLGADPADQMPTVRKYRYEDVKDLLSLISQQFLEIRDHVATCSDFPSVMQAWQELKRGDPTLSSPHLPSALASIGRSGAGSSSATGAARSGSEQHSAGEQVQGGSPSRASESGSRHDASPSRADPESPPADQEQDPPAPPAPPDGQDPAAAAAASRSAGTGQEPPAPEAPIPEDEIVQIEHLHQLHHELQAKRAQLRDMEAAVDVWCEWHADVEKYNHLKTQLYAAEDRHMSVRSQLDRFMRMSGFPDAQQYTAAPAQVQVVWAFVNGELGTHVTPSSAVYYILRAVMEAAYLVKGKLIESEYRQMFQQAGQSLDAWGSKCLQMSQSYPHIDEDTHRTIFLHGIRDRVLQNRIRKMQTESPLGQEWSLQTLVSTASSLANREASLLQGEINSLQLDDKTRRERQQRLSELQYLLGGGGPARRGSSSRGSEQDRKDGDKPRGSRDGKLSDKEAEAKRKYEEVKRAMPKSEDRRGLQKWGRDPCYIHGKAHTNAQCQKQKQLYAQRMAAAIVDDPVTFLADLEGASTPRYASSSSVMGLRPHTPSVQGMAFPYSAYDMASASVVQTQYQDDHSVMSAPVTIKEQRRQGLPTGSSGGRGPGRPPGRPMGGGECCWWSGQGAHVARQSANATPY